MKAIILSLLSVAASAFAQTATLEGTFPPGGPITITPGPSYTPLPNLPFEYLNIIGGPSGVTNVARPNPKDEIAIATIQQTTVTNVTNGDNHTGCATCAGIAKHHWAVYHECDIRGPYVEATERWTRWDVSIQRKVTVNAPGIAEPLVFYHSVPVTNWTVTEKLVSTWQPVTTPAKTNSSSLQWTSTNIFSITGDIDVQAFTGGIGLAIGTLKNTNVLYFKDSDTNVTIPGPHSGGGPTDPNVKSTPLKVYRSKPE